MNLSEPFKALDRAEDALENSAHSLHGGLEIYLHSNISPAH